MRLGDGTPGQKALFAALVTLFLAGVGIAVADKLYRIGQPNAGWMIDDGYVSPTRRDASQQGLRGGGRALAVNDIPVEADRVRRGPGAGASLRIGDRNTLAFRTPRGKEETVTVEVEPWSWHDVAFTEGATDVIAALFFAVGAISFILRPYEIGSWALLALSCIGGASLGTVYTAVRDPGHPWTSVFFLFAVSLVAFAPFHTGLAFPVAHRVLLHHPRVLWLVYGPAFLLAALNVGAWYTGLFGLYPYTRDVGAAAMLASTVFVIGRCCQLAFHGKDPLVAQRARILLGGAVVGLSPFAVAQFMQQFFGLFAVDNRFTLWPLAVLVLALGRITVRQELLNARIAVRRAVLYAGAVGVLTVLILVIIAIQPYAVPVLLFPVLYLWPRFDKRLNERLYPQRARFPELLRAIGAELAACGTVESVLDTLAQAPGRLCDARTSVAFLLAGAGGVREHVRATTPLLPRDGPPLADEPVVQLLRTTRKELLRNRIAVEPQYSNIAEECYAGLDRLGAEVLVPMTHQQRVMGGLAVGPRASGDVYEAAEIDALSTVTQQAVQAVVRVEATERLRARELEFLDLKRFFPPQIIDQVMARGGAAELRSQRKLVTVVFADLRGFTSFSDTVEPEEVMTTLAEYHAVMGRRIAEFAGTLEHFAGDGFMVFFNDPVDQPDHAERAARMALAMRADADRLREEWSRKGYQIHIGIGIDTGYATCGFIGYEGRRDYSVIGNVTNLAARLSDAASAGEILVSARVRAALNDRYRLDPAGELTLKGFLQPHSAYRLLGGDGAAST
jgi:class 3 adenylate cyclase